MTRAYCDRCDCALDERDRVASHTFTFDGFTVRAVIDFHQQRGRPDLCAACVRTIVARGTRNGTAVEEDPR
jgi:hypothetical protein